LALAERLEEAWQARQVEVERLAVHQLTPELILEISREEITSVIFVDTRAVPPEVTDRQVWISPVQAGGTSPSLGHHLDPAALLALAGLLYDKWLPAWLVTVPGLEFAHGEKLSPTARQAIETTPELSTKLLEVICV
jgi:Ni,Fe-hydrogenase maturation factor